jgi:hypothetical protein
MGAAFQPRACYYSTMLLAAGKPLPPIIVQPGSFSCHARLADRVVIQKDAQSLPVMPVPDQVRDDGSGIQRGTS